LRLYLDTSVISHLFAEDTPEKMEDREIAIVSPAML